MTSAPALRDYQVKMEAGIMACVQRGVPGTIVQLITGGGKTSVAASATAKLCCEMGLTGSFVVHRKELLRQACNALRKAGVPFGVVAPNQELTSHRMHVVSIDTALRRMDSLRPWLAGQAFSFFDEAHHSTCPKYRRFGEALISARLFGLTATPWGEDGRSLGEIFVEQIVGPGWEAMKSDGWIAPPVVYAPPRVIAGLTDIPLLAGDYNPKIMQRLLDQAPVHAATVRYYAKFSPGKPALVACSGVLAAKHAAEFFRRAGWRAKAVWGAMDPVERHRILNDEDGELLTGKTQVVTFSDLINEGVDCPRCSAIYWVRPTKSTQFFLQANGRTSRPVYAPGHSLETRESRLAAMAAGEKPHALIIDLVGNTAEHGMPDADRKWSLHGGIRGMHRLVDKTRRCPECWRVHVVADQCPGCGYRYVVKLDRPRHVVREPIKRVVLPFRRRGWR